jgi:hypothetical protein
VESVRAQAASSRRERIDGSFGIEIPCQGRDILDARSRKESL